MPQTKPVNALSFEEALADLETIVRSLEKGDIPLDDSITSYERGIALKTHCQTKLKDAQEKIEKISLAPDGSITTAPFDAPPSE